MSSTNISARSPGKLSLTHLKSSSSEAEICTSSRQLMKVCRLASSIVTYLGPWTSFPLMVITFIYFQLSLNWPRVSFTLKIDCGFFYEFNKQEFY